MWTGILVSVSASVLFAAMYYLAPWLAPLDGEQIFGWRVLCTLPFTSLILLTRKQWPRVHTMVLHALRNPAWGLALCASAARVKPRGKYAGAGQSYPLQLAHTLAAPPSMRARPVTATAIRRLPHHAKRSPCHSG